MLREHIFAIDDLFCIFTGEIEIGVALAFLPGDLKLK